MLLAVVSIPVERLLLSLLPILATAVLYFKWATGLKTLLYATARMLGQLVAVGFALNFIFMSKNPAIIGLLLVLMLGIATWISLRTLEDRVSQFPVAFAAFGLGSVTVFILVIWGVLQPDPWYDPRIVIPIGGMIFSNAMNAITLSAERLKSELSRHADLKQAKATALKTAMLPMENSFLAVGLVSFPGIMTGQILAGVDPLIAIRYQIVVMAMIFGASGLTSGAYLWLRKRPV